jgi:ADP-heptose:LPS heptosyltransferase
MPLLKILIIRFSSMGDIVLTSPVLRCLKTQLPAVELHYLTKSSNYELLRGNPHISKLHLIDVNEDKVIEQLQREQFDYIIDLHHNLRSWRFKRALKGKALSFNKLNWQKWLFTNFKINLLPKQHIVDRYLATIEPLGVKNDGAGLDYFIPDDCRLPANDFDRRLAHSFVAFSIGGQHATKQLPAAKIAAICAGIKQPVLLMGGKEDVKVAEWVIQQAGMEHVLHSCGKVNINQSADLLRQARLLITHDTALMHIGAALGIHTLAIWGNTVPDFGMYPYFSAGNENYLNFEVHNLACRPCSKIGYKQCPKKHFDCMEKHDVPAIIAATR